MSRKKIPQAFDFPPPEDGSCDVLIIAGEHSGDEQAARMVERICEINPELNICALGGCALKRRGVQVLYDMTKLSVVGLVEVLKNLSLFKALLSGALNWIKTYKPKAVCFVDYPGFNLHLASMLKAEGLSAKGGGDIKLLYYISPQIWAWKARRRFKMAELLDSLAVIFPFEQKCYADTNLNVEFVGHPFISDKFESKVFYDKASPILFLPGSREAAVGRIFPIMLKTLRLMEGEEAVVPYPSGGILAVLEKTLKKFPDVASRVRLRRIGEEGRIGAKAVLMSSGTISLSACLEGIPGAIVYRANPLTYAIGRMVVSIEYLGISNILLDRPAWPEFIQGAAKPKDIARRIMDCIKNPETIARAQA
ncbi:MAG: lipid-A-disaccharide synthase, partial [Opitutales bacterium]|nr:lipid-A-disaccharide synthase [Opitutales bacterium]